jgi:hypothetical protein
MSASIQSQIIAAAVAALNTSGAAMAPAVTAYRCRVEAFAPAQLPAWNVIPDDAEKDKANSYSGVDAWRLRFCVRCMVSAQNTADAAADPLYSAAVKAILADPTMGGLATFAEELTHKWERDGTAATDNLALVVTFETQFSTRRGDPTVSAA